MSNLKAAEDLIKEFEGCKLHAYPDPATNGKPYTVGYGYAGPEIQYDTVWTQEQADDALDTVIQRTARFISNQLTVVVNSNQLCAMVSLAYNIGIGNFAHSSSLKAVNESDFETAANDFLQWNKAGGKVMEGLTRRREAERKLFLS